MGAMGTAGTMGGMGAMGAAGQGVTVATLTTGDTHCAKGGVSITSTSGTAYVCNGTNGTNGTNGVDATAPTGAVMFFNLATCPTGWSELTAARGRYLVGLPSGGTLAGTAGTALGDLENRPTGAHTHTIQAYSSGIDTNFRIIWGTSNNATGTPIQPTDVLAPTGSVAGTNAPFVQLLACQKS